MSKHNQVALRRAKNRTLRAAENYLSDRPEESLANGFVTLSNALVQSFQAVTLSEKRIIMAAATKLDGFKARSHIEQVDGLAIPITKITASEYAEAYEVTLNTAYEALKDASLHLYNRSIKFFEKRKGLNGKEILVNGVTRWVTSVYYQPNEGWVELRWCNDIIDHLLIGAQRTFTRYKLASATSFRSMYSWRLLEFFMQYRDKTASVPEGGLELSINDWCDKMGLSAKQRKNYALVYRASILPALSELRKHEWTITFTPMYAGRKVARIRFAYYHKGQMPLPLES